MTSEAPLPTRIMRLKKTKTKTGYDLNRPDTGKLILPGEKIAWDQHIHAVGEEITAGCIPFRLKPDYVMSPFTEAAVHNTPPVIRFEPNGPSNQGPIATLAKAVTRTATTSAPLSLTVWATDDMKFTNGTSAPMTTPRPPVTLRWSKYRGPGAVTFDKARPEVEKLPAGEAAFSGKATSSVGFSEPGDYVLHVTANDYSGDGGGGFGCCWTTALVKVSVTK